MEILLVCVGRENGGLSNICLKEKIVAEPKRCLVEPLIPNKHVRFLYPNHRPKTGKETSVQVFFSPNSVRLKEKIDRICFSQFFLERSLFYICWPSEQCVAVEDKDSTRPSMRRRLSSSCLFFHKLRSTTGNWIRSYTWRVMMVNDTGDHFDWKDP